MNGDLPTIYALSSGQGRCGVAVVRVSGSQSRFVVETLCGDVPRARLAGVKAIRDRDGGVIDRGLVLWFPGPRSFTGEDSAEFHVHGSEAVLRDLMVALSVIPGCTPAEPGAFVRRAFENGKLDLTAVEGLSDLIEAETTAQRQAALRQADGGLQRTYDRWRSMLVGIMARIEARIDFADEGDVGDAPGAEVDLELQTILLEVESHLQQSQVARGLRSGLTVCLAGPPNAGKSSLMNWLAQRHVAIVDSEAGTTRDRLEARIAIKGVPVTLIDTAGLRANAASSIEAKGMELSEAAIDVADIVLWVRSVDTDDQTTWFNGSNGDGNPARIDITVWNKSDLGVPSLTKQQSEDMLVVSVQSGTGLEHLLRGLEAAVGKLAGLTEDPIATRERHRVALAEVAECLQPLVGESGPLDLELAAESLRQGSHALGRLTGRVGVEEVLGEIFSEFCIGK